MQPTLGRPFFFCCPHCAHVRTARCPPLHTCARHGAARNADDRAQSPLVLQASHPAAHLRWAISSSLPKATLRGSCGVCALARAEGRRGESQWGVTSYTCFCCALILFGGGEL